MNTERALQTYLLRQAMRLGVYARKTQALGRRGFPDCFLAANGRVVLVELKSPSGRGRLSLHQLHETDLLRAAGVEVQVINTKEQVDAIIEGLVDR